MGRAGLPQEGGDDVVLGAHGGGQDDGNEVQGLAEGLQLGGVALVDEGVNPGGQGREVAPDPFFVLVPHHQGAKLGVQQPV